MIIQIKLVFAAVAALGTANLLCPVCGGATRPAAAQAVLAAQAPDTATVRLHISRMTCGSCPVTARIALRRIPGVLSATVTLDDSLGVVRYDPRKVTPAEITTQLTRRTGYPARILADSSKQTRRPSE